MASAVTCIEETNELESNKTLSNGLQSEKYNTLKYHLDFYKEQNVEDETEMYTQLYENRIIKCRAIHSCIEKLKNESKLILYWKCKICDHDGITQTDLKEHVRMVHFSITKEDLLKRYEVETGNKNGLLHTFVCKMCHTVLLSENQVDQHFTNVQNVCIGDVVIESNLVSPYFDCKLCKEAYSGSYLHMHIWQNHFDKIYPSTDTYNCGDDTKSYMPIIELDDTDLEVHELLSESKITLVWVCLFCKDQTFENKKIAEEHFDKEHLDIEVKKLYTTTRKRLSEDSMLRYACKFCDYMHKKASNMEDHCRVTHSYFFDYDYLSTDKRKLFALNELYKCNLCETTWESNKIVDHMCQFHSAYLSSRGFLEKSLCLSNNKESQEKNNKQKSICIISEDFKNDSPLLRYWFCKLCPSKKFKKANCAELHVGNEHFHIEEEELFDYIQRVQVKDGQKQVLTKYHCKVCLKNLYDEHLAEEHYLNHKDLYFSRNKHIDLVFDKPAIIFSVYYCVICDKQIKHIEHANKHLTTLRLTNANCLEVGEVEYMETNVSCANYDKSTEEAGRYSDDSRDKTEGESNRNDDIGSKYLEKEGNGKHVETVKSNSLPDLTNSNNLEDSRNTTMCDQFDNIYVVDEREVVKSSNVIKTKTLLKSAGISYSKETKIVRLTVEELPTEVYSCFMCPHLTILSNEEAREHVKQVHKLVNYTNLVCSIATRDLIENCYEKNGFKIFLIGCPCQYSIFDRDVMSMPIINETFKSLSANSTDIENSSGETKIIKIYEQLFKHHFKYKFMIESKAKEDNSTNLNKSDAIDEGLIKYEEILRDKNIVAVKDLMEKTGIFIGKDFASKRVPIKQVPDEMYACCLCPHKIMLREAEVKIHMKEVHALKKNYAKLVWKIPTHVLMNCGRPSAYCGNIIVSCICQYITFPREMLTEPIIDSTYKKLRPLSDIDKDIDAETKLARIYEYQFVRHSEYKLLKKGLSKGIKKIRMPSSVKINTQEVENVINKNDFIAPKDLFELIGVTVFSNTSGLQRRMVKQLPEIIYSCALCPCFAIFSEKEKYRHMRDKHGCLKDFSALVTTVPIEYLIDKRLPSDKPTRLINCVCQYTKFSKKILAMPVIDYTYEKLIKEFKINNCGDTYVGAATKLLKVYKANFVCHNRHKVLIMGTLKNEGNNENNQNPVNVLNTSKVSLNNLEDMIDVKHSVPTNALADEKETIVNCVDTINNLAFTDLEEMGSESSTERYERKTILGDKKPTNAALPGNTVVDDMLKLDTTVTEKFKSACDQVRKFSKRPQDNDLLELYSLYKQATLGNVNIPKPGSGPEEIKKWEAWNAKKGVAISTAKEQYVAKVKVLAGTYA